MSLSCCDVSIRFNEGVVFQILKAHISFDLHAALVIKDGGQEGHRPLVSRSKIKTKKYLAASSLLELPIKKCTLAHITFSKLTAVFFK